MWVLYAHLRETSFYLYLKLSQVTYEKPKVLDYNPDSLAHIFL